MKQLALSIVLVLGLAACDTKDHAVEPGISFTKIYDHPGFSGDIHPLSIQQIPDSGYLILAAKDTWNVYLLKTTESGELDWERVLEEPYVNPLAGIVKKEDDYFVVCMDEVSLGTYLMKINLQGTEPAIAASFPDITYPLSFCGTPDGGFLIQGYDRTSRSTTLTSLTSALTLNWQKKYAILEDKEESLIRHLTRTGQRMPFFTGYFQGAGNSGYYYFNGFMNFTLSLVFLEAASGELLGNINGFRDQGFITATYPIDAQSFALSRVSFGDNYLLPQQEINIREVGFSGDLASNEFPEISSYAQVLVKEINIGTKPVLLYGTHSKNNQILLYAYDKAGGALLGEEHIGQTNPYEIGDFIPTEDQGLIVLTKTYLAKRFPRLALFKLSKEEVAGFIR